MTTSQRILATRILRAVTILVIATTALSGCVKAVEADKTPPKRSFAQPCGDLDAGTTEATISLKTDEKASCSFSPNPSVSYSAMQAKFSSTDGKFHSFQISGLKPGKDYKYFVRCQDAKGNENKDDFEISFKVAETALKLVLSDGKPKGELAAGTTQTTISLVTNKQAGCKYDTSWKDFDKMKNTFSISSSKNHKQVIRGLSDGIEYNYHVRCRDAKGIENKDDFVISFRVAQVATPKLLLSNGKPQGKLVAGTTQTTISLDTNKQASCKYDTSSKSYGSMNNTFSATNSTNHSQAITGLVDGGIYKYYVRCKDDKNDVNQNDFVISFSVNKLSTGKGFIVGHTNTNLNAIPVQWLNAAKANIHAAYNHTSHGSQLITGLNALQSFPVFGTSYAWQDDSKGDQNSLSLDDHGMRGINDLSNGDRDDNGNGYADWADVTYTFLNNPDNNHINVIMWSWCNIGSHDIELYLKSMEWLISQFGEGGSNPRAATHPVKFVFMTGHANGQGENDSSDSRNKVIRAHVAKYDRILFDFSDIENYDPDNNYYLNKMLSDDLSYDSNGDHHRDANWAVEYIQRHPNGQLSKLTTGNNVNDYGGAESCAHSDGPNNMARLNCVLKGRASWYLFARLAGWDGQ